MNTKNIARSLGCSRGTSNAVLIFTAIDQQRTDIVRSLISHDRSSINCINGSCGSTPLGYCAAKQYLELCTILLDCGADINARDKFGWTALHCAAYHGHENIVQKLIQHGARTNCRTDKEKYSPLHLAVLKTNSNVLRCLIKHYARAKIKDSAKISLLHLAVKSGLAEDDWDHLLSLDIDVNVKNELGQSPLMCAAQSNNIDAMRGLFKGGADINMKDLKGKTPLYVATEKKHLEAMILLVNAEAISKSYSKEDRTQSEYPTSLHLAILNRYEEEWLFPLLKIKSEHEVFNCKKETPLMLAIRLENAKAARILLDEGGVQRIAAYGEEIEVRYLEIAATYNDRSLFAKVAALPPSDKSYDILTSAIENNKELLVKCLVQHGEIIEDRHIEASIREKNSNNLEFLLENNLQLKNQTTYIWAKLFVEYLYTSPYYNDMSKWIIDQGTDFSHIRDDLGFSSMWTAVLCDNSQIIELLMKAKYDSNCLNERHDGKSLLQISIMNNIPKMVKWLLNKGAKPSIEIDELLSAVLSKKLKIVKMLLDSNAEILNHHINIAYYVGCDKIAQTLKKRGGNRFPVDESSSLDCNGSILLMCKDNSSLKQFIRKLEELGISPKKLFINNINDANTMIQVEKRWYPRNYNIIAGFSFANYAKVQTHEEELKNMSEKREYISFTNQKVNMKKWTTYLEMLPHVKFENESSLLAKVDELIERGDDLNAFIFGGWNPLHIAVHEGYHRVAQLLINKGAKGDIPNCNKERSVTIAIRRQDKEMLNILTIPDNLKDKGMESIENFKLYLEKFKDIDYAVIMIICQKDLELKKEMLEELNMYVERNNIGKNIVLYYYDNCDRLGDILKIDRNLVNSQGRINGEGILHKAVELDNYKFMKIFELLENFGIDLDLITFQQKETALYKAIRTDRIEIAELLVVAKADCTLGSHILNTSSLKLAKRKNLQELVELMENAGAKSDGQKMKSLLNLSRISLRNLIPQKHFRKCIESLDIEKFNRYGSKAVETIQKILFGQLCNGPIVEVIHICEDVYRLSSYCTSGSYVNAIMSRLKYWTESYNEKNYVCVTKKSTENVIQILENGLKKRNKKKYFEMKKTEITEELKNVLNEIIKKCNLKYLWNPNSIYSSCLLECLLKIDPSLAKEKHEITKESMIHSIISIGSYNFKKYLEILKIYGCELDEMCEKEQETPLYKAIRTDRIDVAEILVRAKAKCSLGSQKLNKSSLDLAREKNLDELVNLMENAES